MTPLELKLQKLDQIIAVKAADFSRYLNDYSFIHDLFLGCMRHVDPVFDKLINNTLLVGSVPMNLRIFMPSEFDVQLNLIFPFHQDLRIIYLTRCPGFVQLDLSRIMQKMMYSPEHRTIYQHFQKLVDPISFILHRSNFQLWIKEVFFKALHYSNLRMWNNNGDYFELRYKANGIANSIIAHKNGGNIQGGSTIKIDYVGTFEFYSNRFYHNNVYTIPRGTVQTGQYQSDTSFFLSNPNAEYEYFQRAPQKLMTVARILRYVCCDKQTTPHFKTCFINNAVLWEMKDHGPHFWSQSLDFLFEHILYKLIGYLDACYLPYFWNQYFNLLSFLTYEQCSTYKLAFITCLQKFQNTHWLNE